jgi:hypothetical protein
MLKKDSDGEYINPTGVSEYALETLNKLRKKYDKENLHRFRRQKTGNFVLGQTIKELELRELHRKYKKLKGIS